MLASVAVDDGTSDNVTPPPGWTQIARTDNDVNVALISYWKIAGSQEPTSYTWLISNQTRAVGGITRYSSVDPTNPIDTIVSNTGFSATATTTAITTSAANEEVVSLFATNVAKTFSTPAGMNQKYNQSHAATVGPSIAAFDTLQVSAGSTSTASTIDLHAARYWSTQQIALRSPNPHIAIDTHAGGSWGSYLNGPFVLPMTISGSNRLLMVHVTIEDPTNPDQVTAATFGGNNLTLLQKVGASDNGNDETYLFAMVAPPEGTNNISVTTSGFPYLIDVEAADYTGVNQTIPSNIASNTATGQTNFYIGPMGTNPNSWVVGAVANTGSSVSIDAPNVVRDGTGGNARVLVDSNGPTGGSDWISASAYSPNSAWLGIFAELAPAQ